MTYYILAALYDEPRHGYDLICAIERERGFRPRPEAIYPTLQFLEDVGAVFVLNGSRKRVYELTEIGGDMLAMYAARVSA
ncbi:MAG: helix-turn-helix transcriptional regulator [Candidatus Eremiobacteraeota bacterium]|nr:helix-turn-helix transcriptional regulator [Candidatus Eremiobacteraeota bacterium]